MIEGNRDRPAGQPGPHSTTSVTNQYTTPARYFGSREVDWWAVHEFVGPWLTAVDDWPMAGTIAWQLLSDTDPAKWAAVLDAAQRHALRMDTAQETLAAASRAIAAAEDWTRVAHRARQRAEFQQAHPWSKRVTA
ncbi:MAG: DUF2742 domain-containing protein [Mycobacterium sp.]|nr:DUF2742 domain-containing protein [Mycobacterium sp.]